MDEKSHTYWEAEYVYVWTIIHILEKILAAKITDANHGLVLICLDMFSVLYKQNTALIVTPVTLDGSCMSPISQYTKGFELCNESYAYN